MDAEATESGRQAVALVGALVEAGLRRVVVSPGSRSTPLALACAERAELVLRVVLDERSAAFYALGLADRRREPVALVCTSGSAPAHWLPAVIEASYRRVPLLLLSADRPPELRECGAGQTIDQLPLFGPYVRWRVDAVAPPGAEGERLAASLGTRAWREARGPLPGPVHLNLPYREPFLPLPAAGPLRAGTAEAAVPPQPPTRPARVDWEALRAAGPGWIVAGCVQPADPAAWAEGLFRVSDALGWPILADVTNPARFAPGAATRVVTHYEALAARGEDALGAAGLLPRALLQVGPQPTAKSLRQLLARLDLPRWQWSPDPALLDPSRQPSTWIGGDPAAPGELPIPPAADVAFRERWRSADRAVRARVEVALRELPEESEPGLYPVLAACLPEGGQLFLASSQPVRDAERFLPEVAARGVRVFSNRGANGIDGLVSTAAGLADGGPPTLAVLGDLAFLHDAGGLRALAEVEGSLTLLVPANGGGRIFDNLPVRGQTRHYERLFLTPQQVDLPGLCAAHGIEARIVRGRKALRGELREFPPGARVLVYPCDGEGDRERRAALLRG
jgi:2-succinyl-5-enolpyruvyl-6-hydroxy-3-cyclohexene-1-carboxylate synthase